MSVDCAIAAAPRRRVLLWDYHVERAMIDALAAHGIDVVLTIDGRIDGVPGLHWSDLHTQIIDPAPEAIPSPVPTMRVATLPCYLRGISRLAQVPFTGSWHLEAGGALAACEIEGWARWHMRQCAIVLERYAIDEVWFTSVPHYGIDIAMAELAELRGLSVLLARQLPFAAKFAYEVRRNGQSCAPRLAQMQPWQAGAVDLDLFYMQPIAARPLLPSVLARGRALLQSLRPGAWRAFAARLWRGAVDRDWWPLVFALEALDRATRVESAQRWRAWRRWRAATAMRRFLPEAMAAAPFVYFALHYEPEANADIYGGAYADQLDALEALVAALPTGWIVRVKENPKQRFMRRGEIFFRRFNAIPKAYWVADETPSAALLAQARVVASLCGTVGYEALRSGKSCVYFGLAWYAGLPGTVRFDPGVDLAAAAALTVDRAALDQAVNRLLSNAADGLVQRRFIALLDPATDHESTIRTTAASLAAISRAAQTSAALPP